MQIQHIASCCQCHLQSSSENKGHLHPEHHSALIAGAVRAVALRDAPHIKEEGSFWHMRESGALPAELLPLLQAAEAQGTSGWSVAWVQVPQVSVSKGTEVPLLDLLASIVLGQRDPGTRILQESHCLKESESKYFTSNQFYHQPGRFLGSGKYSIAQLLPFPQTITGTAQHAKPGHPAV